MRKDYGQFCPVAQAAEILAERWTPLVLRELLAGSTRFNELHKGLALMSPSLLSKRLRTLEAAGVLNRFPDPDGRGHLYQLTEAGKAVRPLIEHLGNWGARWVDSALTDDNLDTGLLMWDIRRNLDRATLTRGRTAVVQFHFPDGPKGQRHWWLVADADGTQLCLTDPGLEVDMLVSTDVRTLTRVWMGDLDLDNAQREDHIRTQGSPRLKAEFRRWLRESPFAAARRERPRTGGPN